MKSLIIIAALVFAGCGKKKNEEGRDMGSANTGMGSAAVVAPPAGSAMAGSAMNAAGSGANAMAGSGSATADVDVPTETDFEDQAKAKITDKNVDTELSALEKDLAQ